MKPRCDSCNDPLDICLCPTRYRVGKYGFEFNDIEGDPTGMLDFNDQQCRVCGCTELDCSGCVMRTGEPCSWVPDQENAEGPICSACVLLQQMGFVAPLDEGHGFWEHERQNPVPEEFLIHFVEDYHRRES